MTFVDISTVIHPIFDTMADVCTVFAWHDDYDRMGNNRNDRNDKNADKYIFFDILAFS